MLDELRDLYQEVILDHGKHPRNFRHPDDANREAKGDNPMCGDKVTVFLRSTIRGSLRTRHSRDVVAQSRPLRRR